MARRSSLTNIPKGLDYEKTRLLPLNVHSTSMIGHQKVPRVSLARHYEGFGIRREWQLVVQVCRGRSQDRLSGQVPSQCIGFFVVIPSQVVVLGLEAADSCEEKCKKL